MLWMVFLCPGDRWEQTSSDTGNPPPGGSKEEGLRAQLDQRGNRCGAGVGG